MLRLPTFDLREPTRLDEALALLEEHADDAMVVAGGTDLLPNMKHGLFEPRVLVSLARVDGLTGVTAHDDGRLTIGATTSLADVASDAAVVARAPALAQAASLVAGPQLRTMGTLGGNVMLDTRCQWYNQTHFWRRALGYCLKKDGTVCHVVAGGKKCVAAASNDTAPALMSLGATAVFERAGAEPREVPVADLWRADGIRNKHVEPGEVLTRIEVPARDAGHRGAYGKLRDRGSIDFPLFGCAVRVDLDDSGAVRDAAVCAVALVARPITLRGVADGLAGTRPGDARFDAAVDEVAALAHKQCKPMPNVPGDHEYRREMVPVYVRRTLRAAVDGAGPVHHV